MLLKTVLTCTSLVNMPMICPGFPAALNKFLELSITAFVLHCRLSVSTCITFKSIIEHEELIV